MSNNFTANGYVKRTASEIKENLINELKLKNPSFNEWPADIQNNILDTFIVLISENENLLASFANSMGLAYDNDFMWEQRAKSFGLDYKVGSKSQVTLLFTGQNGTYIPKGTEVNGNFKTIKNIALDNSGQAYVEAESDADNDKVYQKGEINQIVTLFNDATLKVTNPSASVKANSSETIAELRKRGELKARSVRSGTFDFAYLRLLNLNGINERLINLINVANANGGYDIEAIIGGGNLNEIAIALYDSFLDFYKLTSSPSNNDAQRTINHNLNYFGNNVTIKWTLPKLLSLNIKITISFKDIALYEGRLTQLFYENFKKELDSLQVGTAINKATLDLIVYNTLKDNLNIETKDIKQLSYEILDNTNSQVLNFDTNNYLEAIKKDIYVELAKLETKAIK